MGDLNDWAGGGSLDALLEDTDLTDISEHPDFEWNGRLGTWGSGNERDKIDYVLLSPALFAHARGGGVFRMGVYRGPRTRDAWEVYDTLTRDVDQASTTRPSTPTSSGPSGTSLRRLGFFST